MNQERQYFIFTPVKVLEKVNKVSQFEKIFGETVTSPVYKTTSPFAKINVTKLGNNNANELFDFLKMASILTTRTWT